MRDIRQNKVSTLLILAIVFVLPALAAAGENRERDVAVSGVEFAGATAGDLVRWTVRWHARVSPMERVAWAGLGASGLLAAGVVFGRVFRLRRDRVIPRGFGVKCLDRLCDGAVDREESIDYCELNPSPASRVALGAIRRWGRGTADLERGASLVKQVEVAALRRQVGTLRRIAALTPLLGLLGTLSAAGRVLATSPSLTSGTVGPALAVALGPLTAGVALAILALVAYDGVSGKVESLEGDLERIIARTVDAIASADDGRSPRSRGDSAGPFQSPHAFPASRSHSKTHDEVRPIDRHIGDR